MFLSEGELIQKTICFTNFRDRSWLSGNSDARFTVNLRDGLKMYLQWMPL